MHWWILATFPTAVVVTMAAESPTRGIHESGYYSATGSVIRFESQYTRRQEPLPSRLQSIVNNRLKGLPCPQHVPRRKLKSTSLLDTLEKDMMPKRYEGAGRHIEYGRMENVGAYERFSLGSPNFCACAHRSTSLSGCPSPASASRYQHHHSLT